MSYKPKSISLNYRNGQRTYTTFADWQAKQKLDLRTPAQRGISVGSPVLWRHKHNNVITTDHAIVLAISGNTLTLQIKDVEGRTGTADVHEIVSNTDDRLSPAMPEADKPADTGSPAEATLPNDVVS